MLGTAGKRNLEAPGSILVEIYLPHYGSLMFTLSHYKYLFNIKLIHADTTVSSGIQWTMYCGD